MPSESIKHNVAIVLYNATVRTVPDICAGNSLPPVKTLRPKNEGSDPEDLSDLLQLAHLAQPARDYTRNALACGQ
jgi:hypothetical protein